MILEYKKTYTLHPSVKILEKEEFSIKQVKFGTDFTETILYYEEILYYKEIQYQIKNILRPTASGHRHTVAIGR